MGSYNFVPFAEILRSNISLYGKVPSKSKGPL